MILLCALVALGCAAGVVALLVGKISFDMITGWIAAVDMSKFVVKAAMVGIAALFVLLFLLLFAMILPSRRSARATTRFSATKTAWFAFRSRRWRRW